MFKLTVINFTINDKISGIYCILNKFNGNLYIGSASNINRRCKLHIKSLTTGNHHSKLLQRSWDKHNSEAFQFLILELVEINLLLEREQFWIDLNESSNPKLGYNIYSIAGSPLGIKRSEETKALLSKVVTGKILGPRPEEVKVKIATTLTGQNLTQERKDKISKTLTGKKLSEETKAKLKKVWADRKEAVLNKMMINARMI